MPTVCFSEDPDPSRDSRHDEDAEHALRDASASDNDKPLIPLIESVLRNNATTQAAFDELSRRVGDLVGTKIGPYEITKRLGHGRFGEVYKATQRTPIERDVAIKVIRLGMCTDEVIARFEIERQVLAVMEHRHIAGVLDAGTTASGRPYIVMELVKGISITEYCRKHRMSTRERLKLFADVCRAVQHAHQKGIIHRDLKPSNVLVTRKEGKHTPKVVDFGLAKSAGAKLTAGDGLSWGDDFIGTPDYMSPEQASPTALDVDAKTDVYALGVLLYQLLTDTTPFRFSERAEGAAPSQAEIQRIIETEDPEKPSDRLQTLRSPSQQPTHGRNGEIGCTGLTILKIAAAHQTDPNALIRATRGDLDWIVLRAMERDPTQRYETANGLAMDVDRHLANEPISASPPSAMYLLRKFVRRNRRSMIAAGAVGAAFSVGCMVDIMFAGLAVRLAFFLLIGVLVATVAGFIVSWREALRANRDAHLAEVKTAEAEQKAELARRAQLEAAQQAKRADEEAAEAKRQAAIAQSVSAFLNEVLSALSPEEAGHAVMISDLLDEAAGRLDELFGNEPAVKARLSLTIGRAFFGLGRYGQAEPRLSWAKEYYARALGAEHAQSRRAARALALLHTYEGRFEEAAELLTQTIDIQRRLLGSEHEEPIASITDLGWVRLRQWRLDDAEMLLVEALDTGRRVLGEEHPQTLKVAHNLGAVYGHQERLDEAETLYTRTLQIRRQLLGDDHGETLRTMNNLAFAYERQGRLSDAERLFRRTLDGKTRTLGPEHPGTLIVQQNLARAYGKLGREAEATQNWASLIKTHLRRATRADADAASKHAAASAIVTAMPDVVHDVRPAIELAGEACEMTSYQNWEYLETLAKALSLSGQTDEAIRHQRRALELLPDGAPPRTRLEEALLQLEGARSDDAA